MSTHYYQINKQVSDEEKKIIAHIKSIAIESKHSYGKRRIRIKLADKGIQMGLYKTSTM